MRLYVAPLLFALVTALLVPISAGAQESADCVAVYDSTGTRVGRTSFNTLNSAGVLFEHQGRVASFGVTKNKLNARDDLYFTEADCTGDEYMEWEGDIQRRAHRVGTDVWYPDTMATAAPLVPGSIRSADSGLCTNNPGALNAVVPALNFTIPTFTPPFHLEPEACFALPPAVAALTPYGLGAMALVLAFGSYLWMRRPGVA